MVAAANWPAVACATWLLWAQLQESDRQYRQQLQSTARALSSAVDHKIAEAIAINETLATSGRIGSGESDDDSAHISGPELLDGVRILGLKQFGMMAPVVFRSWGVTSTDDFGRIVFELIERGDMRKTERDQLADFCGVYDFEDAFQRNYQLDVSKAFKS